ncbi:prepilin peptidase [Dermabacteraceae bacterium CCM 9520]
MYLTTPALWPLLATFLLIATPLAITDAREYRLPLWLNLSLTATGLIGPLLSAIFLSAPYSATAPLTALAVGLLLLAIFIFAGDGLGFGDVILVFGLTLYTAQVSYVHAMGAIFIGCLLTIAWLKIRRLRGMAGRHIPFGPGLIAGALAMMLLPL